MKRLLLLATLFILSFKIDYAQPGQLDSSFGHHGIVTANLGKDYSYKTAMALQLLLTPGGIHVIQYGQNFLTKRNSDGSRDTGYGTNGYSADAGFYVSRGAVQPDGKIVVVGSTVQYSSNKIPSDFAVARYKTDGTLDSSFSGDGKQTTDFITSDKNESDDFADEVVIQKDEKILVLGYSNSAFVLARYNTDGSPDSTFDGDGKLNKPYNIGDGIFALQNDGKIVAGGGFSGTLRFNVNGSQDTTFVGDTAKAFYYVFSSAVQSDGKIVVAGYLDYFQTKIAIGRYNVDGSLDKSFSDDGIQPISFFSQIAIQNNGKIVVASYSSIYQYNTNGNQDMTFGVNGRAKLADNVKAFTAAIQSDGKIVVGGGAYGDYPSSGYLALARYTDDGKADKTFDKDGSLIDSFHAGNTILRRTVVQKDGKVIAAGRTWNGSNYEFVIIRYNTDGSPDSTFSSDGILMTGFTFNFQYNDDGDVSLAIQNDGKIVAAFNGALARYNADGSVDNTFSGDGKLVTDTAAHIASVLIQEDGKVVAAYIGQSVRRFNTDGNPDKTFGVNGKQTVIVSDDDGNYFYINLAVLQNDGKIVLAGNAPDLGVVRINTNGSLDTTFGQGGIIHINQYPLEYVAAAIQNGKIVLASDDFYRSRSELSLFRLNNDGSSDTTFKATKYKYSSTSAAPVRDAIALQNDGKIIVSGAALLRFNSDGSLDSTFNVNAVTKVDFAINDISISNDKIYSVGGGYNGKIARYLASGQNVFPTVSITTPASNDTFRVRSDIQIRAAAADADGTITKVEFYQGNKLLHTETLAPYGFKWHDVPVGNYTLTAKATDNSGLVTTSEAVHISVLNKHPKVSIITPDNNQSFAAPANIRFEAAASDADGRITSVEFYNGVTLLRTEYKYPYTYNWVNVPAGTYTVTAVATDNFGVKTTSAQITVTVTSDSSIVSSKPYSENEKTTLNDALSLRLSPNPASSIVNIYTNGLQQNKPATLSIISVSGIVLKTMQINKSATQLNVSALVSGVYTVKIISGDKVLHKQFVKL